MRKLTVATTILSLFVTFSVCLGDQDNWPAVLKSNGVRLVRLKYEGGNWDEDMGKGGDYNLLLKLREHTGLAIAPQTEAVSAGDLKKMSPAVLPRFLYVTGGKQIKLSNDEISILRRYCLEQGGMLFIDNTGRQFDQAVQKTLARLFPKKKLVDIPNDDAIYQKPYQFAKGAPPLWHHSGKRALGIKDQGRWIVFYHPGELHDAWKDGHSGVSPDLADLAYKMGINVIHYAYATSVAKRNSTKGSAEP